MHPTDWSRIQQPPRAGNSGSWLGHDVAPRWLRPDVGQAPRERRDQHAVGAQACWRGRGPFGRAGKRASKGLAKGLAICPSFWVYK